MSRPDKTVQVLAKISDSGLFELLATAVLRVARPELYGNMTHPGVNNEGRTVKAPVDGLSFVTGANPRHMVAAHHTSCKAKDLLRKWLFDPATVIPRKANTKSDAPMGDILKTAELVDFERRTCSSLKVTLALTTNREPSVDVTREVERVAHDRGIMLDIWSGSRIAHFLDQSADGQAIRKKFLGLDQEYLSQDLLRELSQKSLLDHQPRAPDAEHIDRLDARTAIEQCGRPVGFLEGASGFGKSVACHRYLSSHLARGGCGIVLPHEVLALSSTLNHALDSALRQLHPALAPESGTEALLLCSADLPLMIIVEDVCRSGQAEQLIEKLSRWATKAPSSSDALGHSWRLICPIWPGLFALLSNQTRKEVEPLVASLGAFSPEDARLAISRRSSSFGLEMSELEADLVAGNLGYDPLLIGLSDFKSTLSPKQVLANFIETSLTRLAAAGGTRTASDYAMTLRVLASHILKIRSINPTWSDVINWFSATPDQIVTLRELVKDGEILRLSQISDGARLSFRHDRVRKWLLVDAVTSTLNENRLENSVLAEPFFSDVLGEAIADPQVPFAIVDLIQQLNPLALFYALQSFGEPSAPVHHAVLTALENWLANENSHSRAQQSLRYNALAVLSDTQSSRTTRLVGQFREQSWTELIAGLRNGDLRSGIDLCRSMEPWLGAGWRDRAIGHAMARFGTVLIDGLSTFLKHADLADDERSGALRLAGHLGSSLLGDALNICWHADARRALCLDDYLWAMAQCGGSRTDELLTAACQEWAMLSDESSNESRVSPRDALAVTVAQAFWKQLPEPALQFFLKRAENDDLRLQLTYMLRGVDHPDVVTFLVAELAKISRSNEGTERFSIFAHMVADHWNQKERVQVGSMSAMSRSRLREIWSSVETDKYERQHSFRIWAAVLRPGDLGLLQEFQATDVLADDMLCARLNRGDESAVPDLDRSIRDSKKYSILQSALGITSAAMITLINECLSQRSESLVLPMWGDYRDQDWHLPALLIRLKAADAEMLLLRHWRHLRFCPSYVQAALYTARPHLLDLVKQVVSECPAPAKLFELIEMHFGIKNLGHPGITRIEQMDALVPYLQHPPLPNYLSPQLKSQGRQGKSHERASKIQR